MWLDLCLSDVHACLNPAGRNKIEQSRLCCTCVASKVPYPRVHRPDNTIMPAQLSSKQNHRTMQAQLCRGSLLHTVHRSSIRVPRSIVISNSAACNLVFHDPEWVGGPPDNVTLRPLASGTMVPNRRYVGYAGRVCPLDASSASQFPSRNKLFQRDL